MDTSKSNREFFAGVSMFSGRPDPSWPVSEALALDLLNRLDGSASYDGVPPSAPPLGYRGVFLRDNAGHEWYAFRAVVTVKSAGFSEARLDENRAFERALLASAPDGLIPLKLVDDELN